MDGISVAKELLRVAKSLAADSAVLRLMTLEDGGVPVFRLPVVRRGSVPALNAWAKSRGFRFVRDTSLFGGYWSDLDTGEAYLFDTP